MTTITSVLVMILVAIFFVSGADAGSVVMGTLSQRGSIEPSTWVVIFWGAATGAVAAIMLVIGGGKETALAGIQNLTFIGSLPFMIVMVLMCFALMKDLRNDPITLCENKGAEILEAAVVQGDEVHDGDFQLEISNVAANEAPPGVENGHVHESLSPRTNPPQSYVTDIEIDGLVPTPGS